MAIKFLIPFLLDINNYGFSILNLEFPSFKKLSIMDIAHIKRIVPCKSGHLNLFAIFTP